MGVLTMACSSKLMGISSSFSSALPSPDLLSTPTYCSLSPPSLLDFRYDEMLHEGVESCLFYMLLYIQFWAKDVDNE